MTTDLKKILKISSLSVFFIFIIIYAFFVSHNLISGIKITNVNFNGVRAESGVKIIDNVLKITGNAKNAVNITLNGREISIDQQGNFNETIVLLLGYNIINIKAKDKFGYVDEKNYQLIY